MGNVEGIRGFMPDSGSKWNAKREQYWQSARQIQAVEENIASAFEDFTPNGATVVDLRNSATAQRVEVGSSILTSWSDRAIRVTSLIDEARRVDVSPNEAYEQRDALMAEILLTCSVAPLAIDEMFPDLNISVWKYHENEGYHKKSRNRVGIVVPYREEGETRYLRSDLSLLAPHIAVATGTDVDSLFVGRELLRGIRPQRVQESQDDFILRRGREIMGINDELVGMSKSNEKAKLHELKDNLSGELLAEWLKRKKEGNGTGNTVLTVAHLTAPDGLSTSDLLEFRIDVGDGKWFSFRSLPPWLSKGVQNQQRLVEELGGVDFDTVKPRQHMPASYTSRTGRFSDLAQRARS